MPPFEIDPDIRKAKTLPSDFYVDPKYFELSKESIFARSWQLVGHRTEMSGLTPVTLLPGVLDEPVLISRQNGSFGCLSNVCTHRGKILVEQPCEGDLIRCRYHGRRFSKDGRFLSMPEFQDVQDFPTAVDDLAAVPFAELGGFLFASVSPHVEFSELLGETVELFGAAGSTSLTLVGRRDYHVNAHWALYCENYLEGFHIPFVHHGLNAVVDYGSYTTETFRFTSVQTGLDAHGEVLARYLFVFPNMMFNFYRWGISVNIVRPVTESKSVVEFITYVSDKSAFDTRELEMLHEVELEDEAVVESVQQGIRSRFYVHGRYSPTREQGTHHFHRLIAEFMN